jgi:solute carrier family 25 thiamine pyrophosphate transporter 19
MYDWTHGSHELIAGALAGMLSKTAVMPFDVVRKRFQVQGPLRNEIIVSDVPRYTRGSLATFVQIIRHEGVLALYKGIGPSLLKAAPSSAVTFFIVNQCHLMFDGMNRTTS